MTVTRMDAAHRLMALAGLWERTTPENSVFTQEEIDEVVMALRLGAEALRDVHVASEEARRYLERVTREMN